MKKIYLIPLFLLTISSFSSKREEKSTADFYNISTNNQEKDQFTFGKAVGKIKNKEMDEASGIVYSAKKNGGIYVHNDSGGGPYVYVIDSLGNDLGMIILTGVLNRDWEDIAIGPDANSDTQYVYVADIGDNDNGYSDIKIYRFLEPVNFKGQISVQAETFVLKYPDGPQDSETLLIDPLHKEIFVISKRAKENGVYKISILDLENGVSELEKVGKINISMLVGGDISRDGSRVLLKTYSDVYYWNRNNSEAIEDLFKRKPIALPYVPEPQGEGIAFHPSGNFYYTLSEKRFGIPPVLYRYDKK